MDHSVLFYGSVLIASAVVVLAIAGLAVAVAIHLNASAGRPHDPLEGTDLRK